MNKLSERSMAAFRARLLAWYARHKRAMPWRGTRDAYCVWVSEVMLQQTRVAAVEPYYRRFVRRFPTVRALARARSEDVLKLWAGLGYYSRAKNLHRAAKEIVAKHGGKFPREVEAALALPGVGRYTAAAVLSIAYGEPLAVVDGNVARVLARLEAVRGELRESGRWRKLERKAQGLMGEKSGEWGVAIKPVEMWKCGSVKVKSNAGEWNQAMMELGATVCTPRSPRCGECPVARWCKARKMGMAERIPTARKKRRGEKIEIAAAVLVDPRGRTLLVKPEMAETNGLFSRMWQFPAVEVRTVASGGQKQNLLKPQMNADKRRWEKKLEEWTKKGNEKGQKKRTWVGLGPIKHSVTYREITLRPFVVQVRELPAMKAGRAVPLASVGAMAVSNATRKIARAAMKWESADDADSTERI